jgi:hypothetical protein
MLFWKLFVVLDVAINIGYWHAVLTGREGLGRYDKITIPIGLVGSLGLISYAFSLPILWDWFWQFFLPIYMLDACWEVAKAINRPEPNPGTYIGAGLSILIIGFTSIALYRLGGANWIAVLGG